MNFLIFRDFFRIFLIFDEFIWIYFEFKRIKKTNLSFTDVAAHVAWAKMVSPRGGGRTCHVPHAFVCTRVCACVCMCVCA